MFPLADSSVLSNNWVTKKINCLEDDPSMNPGDLAICIVTHYLGLSVQDTKKVKSQMEGLLLFVGLDERAQPHTLVSVIGKYMGWYIGSWHTCIRMYDLVAIWNMYPYLFCMQGRVRQSTYRPSMLITKERYYIFGIVDSFGWIG